MIFVVSDPYCDSSFDWMLSKSRVKALVSPRSQAKNVYSSSFQPVISGLLLEMAGAVGSKGCADRTPHPPPARNHAKTTRRCCRFCAVGGAAVSAQIAIGCAADRQPAHQAISA